MHGDQSLNLDQVPPIVEHLLRHGISGMYVCGSTGEGPLLTSEERKATAAAYVEASAGRLPVVVQVGHSAVVEAQQLAAHAQAVGAAAISAFAPYYFKPRSVDVLVECLAQIARGAPGLPFYYYHIPELSGVDAVAMIRVILRYRGHAGLKATMSLLGLDCGPTRLPNVSLDSQELQLRRELDALGFFQWIAVSADSY